MPPLDNPAHERFAQCVAQGRSKREAVIAAGYSQKAASSQGTRLAKDAKVSQRIAELKNRAAASAIKSAITVDGVVDRLCRIAEKAEQCRQFIAAVTALTYVGKHLGMWPAKPVEDLKAVSKIEYKWVSDEAKAAASSEPVEPIQKAGAVVQ